MDKVWVEADQLQAAVKDAARGAVTGQSYLPVLTHILVKVSAGQLALAGSDMDTTIVADIWQDGEAEWAVTVPATTFRDYVATLSGSVELSKLKGSKLRVTGESSRATFTGLDEEEFPVLPSIAHGGLDFGATFLEGVRFVKHAMSKDKTSTTLSGVHVWGTPEGELSIEAADGFRAARFRLQSDGALPASIIPASAVDVLCRASAESMTVAHDGNQIVFGYGDRVLTTSLLAGNFPDIDRVIAPTHKHPDAISIPRAALRDAVKRAMILSRESNGAVILRSEVDHELTVESQGAVSGSACTTLPVDAPAFCMGFNGRFLLDTLEAHAAPLLEMRVGAPSAPALFLSPEGNTDAVVMPVHLG